jgi:hypothetical protein
VRLIPWRLQRWIYVRVLRSRDRPARAVHSLSLRPRALLRHAQRGGLEIEYFRTYEGPVQKSLRHRYGIVGWRWRILVGLTRVATLGLLTAEDTGIIAIFTKIPLG